MLVSARPLSWLALHPEQLRPGAATPVAYEMAATAWGRTRWPSGRAAAGRFPKRNCARWAAAPAVVHRVNEPELERWTCRKFVGTVRPRLAIWATKACEWAELLTYAP